MFTIKHAAELTGLSVATLRAWERRYGIVAPQRSESGYRLYDEAAVRALTVMNSLVLEGWGPSQAAVETRRRLAAERRPDAGARSPAPGAGDGPGDQGFFDGLGPEALVGPAERLDPIALSEVLDAAFARGSFETVVDGWLMPALHELGLGWAGGRVTVAGEHLVAYAVQRRLAVAFEAAASRSGGRRVVVGLPPAARHEIGVLAFAVAARRVGLATMYVGANLPAQDWTSAVARHQADAAVLGITRAADLPAVQAVADDLRRSAPGLVLAVGGAAQDAAPPELVRLGHEIGPAARRLQELLAAPSASV